MLSFLSSAKPFVGNAGRIQRNAIRSWKAVHPEAEVIIYGDGEGVARVCRELGAHHVPQTPCSPSGVPFFNGIVEHAAAHAKYDVQCYLNCDIILTGDILKAVNCIPFDRYLVTGQRIDMHEGVEIDVESERWRDYLLGIIDSGGVDLHAPTGMDYFIFRRGMWQSLLPLVIGRGGYDEALVLYCLRNQLPFINATLSIVALHQFHDYGHLKGGRQAVAEGDDALNNRRLHRNHHSKPNSSDSPWLIVNGILTVNTMQRSLLRKAEHFVRFRLGLERTSLSFRILWRLAAAIGLSRPKSITLSDIVESAIKER